MLYRISGFRPHSSPDPFGATLSPGEGITLPLMRQAVYISPGYLQKPFDNPGKMCYVNRVQGSDEDTPRRMMPREEPIWCDGSAFGNRRIPLLSR